MKHLKEFKKRRNWDPTLVKMLRGKRAKSELARLLGVTQTTVRRWEAGHTKPSAKHAHRLDRLANRERFLEDWKLAGSMILVGNLEDASRQIRRMFMRSLLRTARAL